VLILLATLSTIALSAFALLATHYGLGTHIWHLNPSLNASSTTAEIGAAVPVFLLEIKHFTQSLFGCYLAYSTAITLVKASIIVSYLRLFPNKALRLCTYGTLVLVLAMWICSIFCTVFTCVPVQAAWNYTVKGRCINTLAYFYVSSSINIVTDFGKCPLRKPIGTAAKIFKSSSSCPFPSSGR